MAKQDKKWEDLSKTEKIYGTIGAVLVSIFVIFFAVGAIGGGDNSTEAATEPTSTQAKAVKTQPTPTTVDKLWTALDDSIGDRSGMDIKYDKGAKSAELINYQSAFINTNDTVGAAYRDFVQWGQKIKDIPGVEQIDVKTQTDFTDSYGKTAKENACEIIMSTKNFKKYNWDNLIGQPIHQQLNQSGMLIIHPAIMKDIKLDDIKLLY